MNLGFPCRHRTPPRIVALAFAAILPGAALAAPNFSLAPGVVISYEPAPSPLDVLFNDDVYIADCEIVVLPNGNYVASHSYFGGGSTETTAAITRVFRSTNQGASWTFLVQFQPLWRASLFVHGGALYILGPTHNGGSYSTIRKSADNGTTWTSPADASTGRFESVPLAGTLGTPNNPLVFNNRLYGGGGGRATMSTPTTTVDPLIATDWRQAGSIQTFTTWPVGLSGALGSAFIGEGGIVASPEQGLAVLAKVEGLPYAAVVRADRTLGDCRFGPANDFAAMPGAEKKFGSGYDAVSGKFYVLSNPILPAHAADASLTPQLKRNTAAVLSSRDLMNWEVEKIFLYSPNIGYEAWQYFQFDFDGGDMVVASRTAFDVDDTYKPPRGHDSNLLTFHRLPNFRTHTRDHYLLADTAGNQVLRYEVNQNPGDPAPLGKFTLGTTFAGAAITAPNGIGVDANADVYIRESGGRILRFDALGNFIAVVATSPVAFTGPTRSIAQPPGGARGWVKSGAGNWGDLLNWYYWGRADTTAEIATFGSAATAATTVTVDGGGMRWEFDTDADEEGWTTSGVTAPAVAGGVLAGTATAAGTPILNRIALALPGSRCPEVRIRLKGSGSPGSIDFYWGNTTADAISSARKVTVPYTGAGAFEEVVVPMAGRAAWDGQTITRIRFDPPRGASATFEVDWVRIPQETFRMKGLRFRSASPYTIGGAGSLRIEADSGNGVLDGQQGVHTVSVPVTLAGTTTSDVATGATLTFSGVLSGAGGIVRTGTGAGALRLSGANTFTGGTTVSGGTLDLTGSVVSAVTVNGGVFMGTGTVNGNVTIVGGVHAPGGSAGIMPVRDHYALQAGGTLRVEINGPTVGTQYDQVRLTGAASTATLAGALDLAAAPGHAAGSTFLILQNNGAAAVSGSFAGLPQEHEFYEGAQWWQIDYTGGTGNDVALTRLTPTNWHAWRLTNFPGNVNDPALASDLANPDADALINLLEYALGGVPLVSSASPLPTSSIVGGRLTLTFTRVVANTDLTLTAQGGDAPAGPWTDLATSVNGAAFTAQAGSVTETGTGATRTVQVRDQYLLTDAAHPRRFLRLRVVR